MTMSDDRAYYGGSRHDGVGTTSLNCVTKRGSLPQSTQSPNIEKTKKTTKPTEPLGVAIHDHPVIGGKGHAGFRSPGLL